jgi:hypothetical protein
LGAVLLALALALGEALIDPELVARRVGSFPVDEVTSSKMFTEKDVIKN